MVLPKYTNKAPVHRSSIRTILGIGATKIQSSVLSYTTYGFIAGSCIGADKCQINPLGLSSREVVTFLA